MLKNDTGSLSPPPWRGVGGGFTAMCFCHPKSDTCLPFVILQCDRCPWTLPRGVLPPAGWYSLEAGLCLGEDRAWWGTACPLYPVSYEGLVSSTRIVHP